MPTVTNLESPRSGKPVPNQFVIKASDGEYFQSYKSVIVYWPKDQKEAFYRLNPNKSLNDCGLTEYPKMYLDESKWDYSKTTNKYRNEFTGYNTAETKKAIKDKTIMLIDLN